jgi:hypothetical protein
MRQQQDSVGAGFLRRARNLDREFRAVAASRYDGGPAGALLGRAHDGRYLVRPQREELAGAAGGKQYRRIESRQPFDLPAITLCREFAIGIEMRDGKREEP